MAKAKKKKSGAPKRNGPFIPKRSNEYIHRRDSRVIAYRQAEKDTTVQYMTDILILTLNDPDIMGKDVFGKKRLAKVIKGLGQKWDLFHGVLELGVERDYYRAKLDEALRKILGDDIEPFSERYPWIDE